jgi:two-component system, OmpR family, response regulator
MLGGQAELLPRYRELGNLRLDLFARDGFVGRQQLGLHPREFALIWRLADSPGIAVAKKVLVRDVWRMAHVPDTNSLAVHVFRLRAKLAIAGLAELVRTSPSGGYFLALPSPQATVAPFMLAESDGQEAAAMAMSVEQNLTWEPQP